MACWKMWLGVFWVHPLFFAIMGTGVFQSLFFPQFVQAESAELVFSPLRLLVFSFFGFAVAAYQEESLFRGALQDSLTGKFGSSKAIFFQAAIFSITHIGYYPVTNFSSYLNPLIAGLILGFLRYRRGNLVAPAVAHGLVWTSLGFFA